MSYHISFLGPYNQVKSWDAEQTLAQPPSATTCLPSIPVPAGLLSAMGPFQVLLPPVPPP